MQISDKDFAELKANIQKTWVALEILQDKYNSLTGRNWVPPIHLAGSHREVNDATVDKG